MKKSGVAIAAVFLFLSSLLIPVGASAEGAKKSPNPKSVELSRHYRDKLAARPKTTAAKTARPRVAGTDPAAPNVRALQFADRANTAGSRAAAAKKQSWLAGKLEAKTVRPVLPESTTAKRGTPFEGRNGTGLGDIFEDEPNDSTAEILDDLPVNVVGEISVNEDIDFFAITATQGESIRIEVVADRIFGSFLDSYLVVFDEDGETLLAENDDFFENSRDSFIRFIAPNSGERLYFVGVTDLTGLGGTSFDYVLNLTVADAPDLAEVEPNDTTPLADSLPPPGVIFGVVDAGDDLDVFIFDGIAGEALIVDVDAELFLSDLDPVVELFDDRGGFLFGNDDADGLDSRFNIVLPYTGEYYLAVYNAVDTGGSSYFYSMNVSTQSGALAPRVSSFKILSGSLLKKVTGQRFDPSNGGSFAEIDGEAVNSDNAPRKPTTAIRIRPAQPVITNDVVTVVNPDGRRSNPGVINLN